MTLRGSLCDPIRVTTVSGGDLAGCGSQGDPGWVPLLPSMGHAGSSLAWVTDTGHHMVWW